MKKNEKNWEIEELEKYQYITDSIDALLCVVDVETNEIRFANQLAQKEFGSVVGKPCFEVMQKDQDSRCDFCVMEADDFKLEPGFSYTWEHQNTLNNKIYLFNDKIVSCKDERLAKIQIGIDISQRKSQEEIISQERDKAFEAFEALTNATIEGLLILDEDKRCMQVNTQAPLLFGYTYDEMIGKFALELIADTSIETVRNHLQNPDQEPYEALLKRKDGSIFPALVRGKNIMLGDKKVRVSAILDITDMKAREDEISKLAYFDPLTGLANRTHFFERLNQFIAKSVRDYTYGALMFVDLDHFKQINDTRGHFVGDMILMECAKRISSITRKYDLVSRVGGDEFVILIDTQSDDKEIAITGAKIVAKKILEVLKAPFQIREVTFRISASIGISIFRENEVGIDEIMKYADSAMYHAKEKGRGTYSFFDPKLQAEMEEKARYLENLRDAVLKNEIDVFYQKIVDRKGAVLGVEALARWRDETLGDVAPSIFIPIAEHHSLIVPLGEQIMVKALDQMVCWKNDPDKKAWKMYLNVSVKQIERCAFDAVLEKALHERGLDPRNLHIEIKEGIFDPQNQAIRDKILAIKALGVKLAIDDFGTGYSSFACLKKLPIDELKIDRTFIAKLTECESDEVTVSVMIELAKKFGFNVTAEGVENEATYIKLLEMGCDLFQGFHFAKPLPAKELS